MKPIDTIMTIVRSMDGGDVDRLLDQIIAEQNRRLGTNLTLIDTKPMGRLPKTGGFGGGSGRKVGKRVTALWYRRVDKVDWDAFEKRPNLRCVEGVFLNQSAIKNVMDGQYVIVGRTNDDDRKELALIKKNSVSGHDLEPGLSEFFPEAKGSPILQGYHLLVRAVDDDDNPHYAVPPGDIEREFPILQKAEGRASQHILYELKRLGM